MTSRDASPPSSSPPLGLPLSLPSPSSLSSARFISSSRSPCSLRTPTSPAFSCRCSSSSPPDLARILTCSSPSQSLPTSPFAIRAPRGPSSFAPFASRPLIDISSSKLPEKNTCSYNILLKAMCSAGRIKDARQLFDEMASPPDVVTYGIMLSDAVRVVEDMVMHGVVLDAMVFTTIMSGFCRKGDLAAARNWFDEMQKRGMAADGVTYTVLINGLCRAGELKEAERVLQEMEDKGLDVDAVTYTALIDGYCKVGKMMEAFLVHNKMVQKRVTPNVVTYTALSDGLCKQGDVHAANELLHEMCNKGLELNVFTYNSLINGLCKAGNLEQAMRTMIDMDEAGLKPDVYTYTTIIGALCQSRELGRAHSLLQEMVEGGKRLLEWMLEKNICPNTTTYNSLMKQCCIDKNMKSTTEIYKGMLSQEIDHPVAVEHDRHRSWVMVWRKQRNAGSLPTDSEGAIDELENTFFATVVVGELDTPRLVLHHLDPSSSSIVVARPRLHGGDDGDGHGPRADGAALAPLQLVVDEGVAPLVGGHDIVAVEATGRVSKKPSGSPVNKSPRRERGAVALQTPAASVPFKKGDEVRVRTPVGRLLPSTLRLVIWLGAVVVSTANDDGHLDVIYNGNFPRDDPFRTVRVATKDVKFPAVDNAAPRPPGNMATRRPTTGGKSVPLLKRLEKEMRANSDAL
ncbi:hypothetical protein E2562_028599 [Oryza meyeriana var. granulata]|uniref:Pentatricopeptide repeat-containing protein n=1 Tax=Oryza meyeriana var. granulata TaxID=110450 RepID=A0A6G1D8Q4_9ORYZ|nr:hypothetical protein E2562_028599 [Oryza meyeriana var. granulata]